MNRRADVSLTFALCASLVLHGLLSLALAEAFVRDVGGRIWLPPPAQRAQAEADAPLPRFDLQEDPRRRLGDAGGTGYAIDESPGEKQLLARQGSLDQPMLSRDPVGPGRVGDEPSEWTAPPGDGGATDAARLPSPAFASASDAQAVGITPPVNAPSAQPQLEAPREPDGDVASAQATPPQAAPQPAVAMSAPSAAALPATDGAARPGPRGRRPGAQG